MDVGATDNAEVGRASIQTEQLEGEGERSGAMKKNNSRFPEWLRKRVKGRCSCYEIADMHLACNVIHKFSRYGC